MKRLVSYLLSALVLLALFSFAFSSGYLTKQYPIIRYGLDILAVATVYRTLRRRYSQRSTVSPPIDAQFLFYLFLDPRNCDAIVGDLEERYRLIRRKLGARRANFWYWTQAIRSVGPIAWVAIKKLIKVATGLAALVELYQRIRS